jgi:hypothetical protein
MVLKFLLKFYLELVTNATDKIEKLLYYVPVN